MGIQRRHAHFPKDREALKMSEEHSPHGQSITTLESREVYRNPWLRLREDRILRSNGDRRACTASVDKDDCAIIIPLDETCRWVRASGWSSNSAIQSRSAALSSRKVVGRSAKLTPKSWPVANSKKRPASTPQNMVYLGTLWIAYGFANQKQHVFLATGPDPHRKGSRPRRARSHRPFPYRSPSSSA